MSAPQQLDERLRLSRRLDWRFLAGGPDMGDVGCSSSVAPELVTACRAFARSCTVLDRLTGDRRFDIIVLDDPGVAELFDATRLLRPSGWLYVEFGRSARTRRTRCVWRSARVLRQLDLNDVTVAVHWPSYAAAEEIFAVHDATARRAWLARRGAVSERTLRATVLRPLTHPGILTFLAAPSVVGRLPGDGDGP